jgi:major vault protein
VTRCIVGPATFTRQDHEKILFQPKPCIAIPPRSYCRIRNPAVRDGTGQVVVDESGTVQLKYGDEEIRLEQEPFPLMPGEVLLGDEKDAPIKKLSVIPKGTALRLRAAREFVDGKAKRSAGEEWMFEGPNTYMPRVEVDVVQTVRAQVIKPNSALRLRARVKFTDHLGKNREVGEEWLIKDEGAYLPSIEEEVVGTVDAKILTDKVAISLVATRTATDVFGKLRKAGEQWLVTNKDAATHIPDVFENVNAEVKVTTLNNRQYCVVLSPIDLATGRNRLGEKEIRKGELSFFLHPGESLANGIEDIIILGNDEALLLKSNEEFTETLTKTVRKPGERWMIQGPVEYIPPVQVSIVERRRAIALDANEGVYIRNDIDGKVRAEKGKTYLLKANESLWEKEMHPAVEDLLMRANGARHMIKEPADNIKNTRIKSRVVRFNVQHNAAVQVYDYKEKSSRIVFGPDLVMLGPDEQFTMLSLSGDKPKVPNVIKSLQLFLGPDFMSDTVIVETSDHARLQLKLSYNWQFEIPKDAPERIFAVPDFVGDACKAIASRVRGAVASESFDSFHRHSARIIRTAIFGMDEQGKIKEKFIFPANNLVMTNIDIQSVEPTDVKTRDSLQKSVQLAIEITTQSQEAAARHEKERKDQQANGQLERQKLVDKAAAEKAKTSWLGLQAESAAIEACGKAIAESKARAESALIEAQSELKQSELRAQAYRISAEAELDHVKSKQSAELDYTRRLNELELKKARELSEIEGKKLAEVMDAIGAETVVAIAQAGPEMQAKLLEGLGLKGYLITDGNSPINLFSTANGMMGAPTL